MKKVALLMAAMLTLLAALGARKASAWPPIVTKH
jgi:hypothetical protein